MRLVRLTPDNAKQYIGRDIVFTSRNKKHMKILESVSESGKTVYISHPDLKNCLVIEKRKVFVLLDD